MKIWYFLLVLSGIAAVGVVYAIAMANHAFDGCRVEIASESSTDAHWTLRYHSDAYEGNLPVGSDPVVIRLCTFAPRNDPTARFDSDRGSLTLLLDPYCSDLRIVVNGSAARLDARVCS